MKEFAQTILILGGGLGLFAAVPISLYGWAMHRGFGGDMAGEDYVVLFGPFICLAALGLGLVWRRAQTGKRRSSKFKLTEDGGAFSDVGGAE